MNDKAHPTRRAVALYRVSTDRQGKSGLGLEAQREAVQRFLTDEWELVEEVAEVASGRRQERPGLDRAISLCRAHNATLVIARLCRLSRDPHFLLGLERAGVEFLAVDMPGANEFTIGVMALVAREEIRLCSTRTREALAARRARGLPLGGNNPRIGIEAMKGAAASASVRRLKADVRACDLMPIVADLRAEGAATLEAIAGGLNTRGVRTARGGSWSRQSVRDLLRRQDQYDAT